MGQNVSAIEPSHVRIYRNLIQINDPAKRVQVIQTCMASLEYVASAKRAGVYSYLLQYMAAVQHGGALPRLPEESQAVPLALPASQSRSLAIMPTQPSQPSWKVVADTPQQKAISHFSACLEVLQIQEEVAITEDALKRAYKRMALKAHPDKGGSEEHFEAVTRAYAYLSDILKRMKGARPTDGRVDASAAQQARASDAKEWDREPPVRLNAKNLDMNAFNQLFEQTHMPDPDTDGYGDWLKDASGGKSTKTFKGEFNRDVFNRMFEEEARGAKKSTALTVHPGQMALTLNPTAGTDLCGQRPDSYTAATGSKFQYTDLRGAYTDSTITDQVADVRVDARSFDQYRASRDRAPDPLTDTEMHGIREFESRQKASDDMLGRRRAEMASRNQQYHDRMKQRVITDGVNLNQKTLGWQ